MEIFFLLVSKILPLYVIILLGFIAGKYLKVNKESLANLLIYIITPLVVFHGVYTTNLSVGVLMLPVIFFAVSVSLCVVFYFIGKNIWQDATKNILAFASGTGNTGYFGLPVALAIFGPSAQGLVVLCILGSVLYENTLGFFITAKGQHTSKEALMKLVKLPAVYAFLLALVFNFSHVELGQGYFDFAMLFRGAYSVLGMMIIGLGVSAINWNEFEFDWLFVSLSFLAKFIVWPVLMFGIVILDRNFFQFIPLLASNVLLLLASVPLAANTVAYATALNAHPQKAAVAVLLSTILALVYIPLVVILFKF